MTPLHEKFIDKKIFLKAQGCCWNIRSRRQMYNWESNKYFMKSILRTIKINLLSVTWESRLTCNTTRVEITHSLSNSAVLSLYWLGLAQLDSAWFSLTQLDSAWFNLTQLDSTWLSLTHYDSVWLSLTQLDSAWFSLTQLDYTWLRLAKFNLTWISVYISLWYRLWLSLRLCLTRHSLPQLVLPLVPAFLRHVSRSTPPETLSDLSLELDSNTILHCAWWLDGARQLSLHRWYRCTLDLVCPSQMLE